MRASTETQPVENWAVPGGLDHLLFKNRYNLIGKFVGDRHLSEQRLWDSLLSGTMSRMTQKTSLMETLDDSSGRPVGAVFGEKATWDSEHFRKNMGKVTLFAFDGIAASRARGSLFRELADRLDVEMLSARVNMTDLLTIQGLEQEGAILVDVLMTFRFDTSAELPKSSCEGIDVNPATAEDHEELIEMGGRIFSFDRFHSDPLIAKPKSDELYSKWVSSSLAGLANEVLVARGSKGVSGFITCKLESPAIGCEYGVIDLVGVSPEFSGNGVGFELVRSALEWFGPRVKSVYVGTQAANARAIRLYERTGFLHVSSEPTLHLWSRSGK